ncbi:PolC-type DNA polymerase III [Alicyclobacillus macrosporangiidus]|uniref:PolC-type DNA polymerase III n=1 Tax=Alicyclobacillus macrosporangiidus TaxID=392015 RepID=UPI00069140E5|nr:PolC-type DNA polymerase III [Alicyclobacillus macrosporangiidus]
MAEQLSADWAPAAADVPGALDAVEKVIVRVKSRQVFVHLRHPGLWQERIHDASQEPGAGGVSPWSAWLTAVRRLEAACRNELGARTEGLHWVAPAWPNGPTEDEVRAALAALVEDYTEREPVAGQWLKQAECTVEPEPTDDSAPAPAIAGSSPPATAPSPAWRAVFWVTSAAEVGNLARKEAGQALAETAARWFGINLQVAFEVHPMASERVQGLREALEQEERQQVQEVLEQMEQKQAEVADRPQPLGDKPAWGEGRRRGDRRADEPVQPLTVGRPIDGPVISIDEIQDEMRRAAIEGRVFAVDTRTLPSGRTLVQFNITDETNSITAKLFIHNERQQQALEGFADGAYVRIQGQVQFDAYAKELVFMVSDMQPAEAPVRVDQAEEKRVELHLHSNMSALDGIPSVAEYIRQAARWGHEAIAVTDHGVVQSFPEAYQAGKKHGVKVLLGVEAYVVDDGTPIVYRMQDIPLDDRTEYVVFDTETTGLNAREDTLIELAAVRMRGGEIIDTFATLIDPERPLSPKISELTGITPDMLVGQPKLAEALEGFRRFAEGAIWVAHNAEFDVGFLGQCAQRLGMEPWRQPVIDTLALARVLYPGEKSYKLKTLTQKFSVELVNHHRALADAEATGRVFAYMLDDLAARGISRLPELNQLTRGVDVTRTRPFHATLLVVNQTGLRNLYELVSLAHTQYLYRTPRIPRSELVRLREGLLVGSACQQGEVVQAFLRGKTTDEIEEICRFYDFLEIQPVSHYENLVREELIQSVQSVREMHRQLVEIGKRLNIPVVATGDAHYVNPSDRIYREVFLQAQNGAEAALQPPLHLRTTDEMLAEFQHLGEDAYDVVVTHTRRIAALVEEVKPIPDELFTPVIDGAEDEITRMAYDKAKRLYGDPLPEIVAARLEKELNSIIQNGFAVIYLIAHKLVVKSLSDGYLVGSRGSVGSSLVATMTDITEVNPLPPHYLCPQCQYSEFITDGSVGSGFDLPAKDCPRCGAALRKDGQDIPFETFLGFNGDKVPDIDLNFSGEYQPRAHRYTEELFGKDHVFRAGTISAVAEKTAYGYVRKFAEERGLILRNAEIDRLVKGCTGIKRTTGQHPGGQVVVPHYKSIYDFTPVQYPADDKNAGTLTTHFDYHSGLENCLLKLDILGHDDPTVIRMLQDLTGVDPKSIPMDDPQVLGLFSGTETLGVKPEDIRSATGTYAIPEFGTKFVRQMLEDTRPTTFSELVRISGLSHGTDVWLNNAQDLIRNGIATLSEVICARDDIMVYLIYKGLEPARAFKIMESIRKGKGVKEEDAEYMRQFGVPEWYIESGRKIKYMFPKAHAAAYVLMAMRIAWFKVHYPLAFYATYFTVRADDFDVELMVQGRDAIVRRIEEIEHKGNGASPKEKSLLTVLEVALEMVVRGFRFLPIDLMQSHATQFLIREEENALLPPFAAVPGIGEAAAKSLYQACQDGPFLSVEDLQERSRVGRNVIEVLEQLGCLKGLPETNQLSLF